MSRPAKQIRKMSFTLDEAAKATGLSARTVRRLGDRGMLVLIKIPGVSRTLVAAESIERLLEKGKAAAVNG